MIPLFYQLYQRRKVLSRGTRRHVERQTPMTSTQPSGSDVQSAGADLMALTFQTSFAIGLGGPLDVTRNRDFAELALLSITGPHSYVLFEVFELSDILFYFPEKAGYFN